MSWLSDPLSAPYLALILFGFLPSEIWRLLSVFIAPGIDEDSEIFVLARTIATVLLIGVVAKIVLRPAGDLALVPIWARCAALGAGGLAFVAFRRSVLAAIVAGEAFIALASYFYL